MYEWDIQSKHERTTIFTAVVTITIMLWLMGNLRLLIAINDTR